VRTTDVTVQLHVTRILLEQPTPFTVGASIDYIRFTEWARWYRVVTVDVRECPLPEVYAVYTTFRDLALFLSSCYSLISWFIHTNSPEASSNEVAPLFLSYMLVHGHTYSTYIHTYMYIHRNIQWTTSLTWSLSTLRSYWSFAKSRRSPSLVKHEGSFPYSQNLATGPHVSS
jgi:hypothetical protein